MNAGVRDGSTNRFHGKLQSYLTSEVVDGDGKFVCGHGPACEASASSKNHGFASGQLSYVGSDYGMSPAERPLRIVVVSMQVGDAEAPVTMSRREEQVRERISGKRNPHMRGVTRALQVLYSLPVDPAEEVLPNGAHLLDSYAMINTVLCSALPTGGKSRRGSPTDEMVSNCSGHLLESLRLLEPNIVLTQGVDPRNAVRRLATSSSPISEEVSEVSIADRSMVLCSLSHPAAGPPKSWSSIKPGSYFDTVVVAALRLAQQRA